ncbi:MAG: aminoacetone oxidase family FAD-binding enzyme [Oscillospiraceae bacterium]|nr:aminoacetone oxidase family FAD-binding enzyme [Oscillospiraceae bacterium]
MKKVVIIGGGASGMAAALTAAEGKENTVILLERQSRVGRKLLATGNGRCNLTNTGAALKNYHGQNPAFALPSLQAFPPEEVITWFRSLGLVTTEQYGGRVFPLSESAGSVLDVLRFALASAGVAVHAGETAKRLEKSDGKLTVTTDLAVYRADAVIVACGGKAGGKLGGVSDGYDLLSSLGHRCTPLYPALVPLKTDTDFPRSLKGVRAEAAIRLVRGGKLCGKSRGELQFTEKGVSGPAAFDLSREASVGGGELILDFLPDLPEEEVLTLLCRRQELSPELENGSIFAGMLHSRLGMAVVRASGLRPSGNIGELTARDVSALLQTAKAFCLCVTGTDSFDNAQITAGGICTDGFDPDTLESRLVPGVFACGEVLDLDGDCGGYNLQWAWASGRKAGRLGA